MSGEKKVLMVGCNLKMLSKLLKRETFCSTIVV
jgi:hypothetical protein